MNSVFIILKVCSEKREGIHNEMCLWRMGTLMNSPLFQDQCVWVYQRRQRDRWMQEQQIEGQDLLCYPFLIPVSICRGLPDAPYVFSPLERALLIKRGPLESSFFNGENDCLRGVGQSSVANLGHTRIADGRQGSFFSLISIARH